MHFGNYTSTNSDLTTPRSAFSIVIMASGSGTNAQRIIEYFQGHQGIDFPLLLTNNPQAGVIGRAQRLNITFMIMEREVWADGEALEMVLKNYNPDLIVLAGYLKKIPKEVIEQWRGRIVNIHPSLLPAYGGKGMYGQNVHEAVIAAGDSYSGITIHLVDEEYDQGQILLQEKLEIQQGWGVPDLQAAIHELEYLHFPKVIESLIRNLREES